MGALGGRALVGFLTNRHRRTLRGDLKAILRPLAKPLAQWGRSGGGARRRLSQPPSPENLRAPSEALSSIMAAAGGGGKRCRRLDPSLAPSVFSGAEAVLFDCDGVLWRGDTAVPGAAETLRRLEGENDKKQKRRLLCYVTNNSSRTREAYTEKLRRLGFPPAEARQVFGSGFCAARFLRAALPPGGASSTYVLGGPALAAELEAAGVPHLGAGPTPESLSSPSESPAVLFGTRAALDPSVGAVLVGYDEHFSYGKLCLALRYLRRDPQCLLVGTNRDHRLPLEGGSALPGTGCLVKAVETAAEREAFIVGKPSRYIFECVMKEFNIDPARTIMVGDRLDTDILMGEGSPNRIQSPFQNILGHPFCHSGLRIGLHHCSSSSQLDPNFAQGKTSASLLTSSHCAVCYCFQLLS
nr:PREDICTED: glycerol-3-phosphate phosphatase isoform X1 [Anolis carolinensis]|eukprot:XP_016853927.1 PREDICTED: glycerol-3-phosphate phosphatase isoform X1 [Anolis carolinensis]